MDWLGMQMETEMETEMETYTFDSTIVLTNLSSPSAT